MIKMCRYNKKVSEVCICFYCMEKSCENVKCHKCKESKRPFKKPCCGCSGFIEPKNEKSCYYKLVKRLDINLKLYKVVPMYDEYPDLGSYESTLGVSQPQKGDYLIYNNKDITFFSVYRDFDEVSFTHKINLEDLLKKGIIHKVSFKVYSSDIKLQNKIKKVCENIQCSEFGLEIIKDSRENYSEESIRREENKIVNLNEQLKKLKYRQAELFEN